MPLIYALYVLLQLMKTVDYIIVGCGLAGIAFCEQLGAQQKRFVVFDDASQQSSIVAGGLYNPVVLKRFTPVWLSALQLEKALPVYSKLETLLKATLDYKVPVWRTFASIEEQNNWFTASDKPGLSPFLSLEVLANTNTNIKAPLGFGEVKHTGRVATKTLIRDYKAYLQTIESYVDTAFKYTDLNITSDTVQYANYTAKHIVFAEGFGMKQNPFFNHLPLQGTKGELLTIKAPDLKLSAVVKSSVFIIPLGDDLYRVGATYEWKDKTHQITEEAKEELLSKLNTLINCDYEVVEQVAGIRPTVIDRRPLVGQHTTYRNLYVLNGLGTRGVMIAPYVAEQLYQYIEDAKPLNPEIDIKRFA